MSTIVLFWFLVAATLVVFGVDTVNKSRGNLR
jgi:hypothetical protein